MRARHVFKSDKNRESFREWTAHRIEQMSAATSVIFVVSSAALGYALTLVSDDHVGPAKLGNLPFVFSVIAFLISFAAGIWVVYNRLISFRQTCEIIKL